MARQPALCLLHGLGCDATSFDGARRDAGLSRWRLVVPDLPGHGAAPHRPGQRWDLQSQAEAVERTLSALGCGPAHLVGHSMGGAVALIVASRGRVPVASLVTVEGNLVGADCDMLSRRIAETPARVWRETGYQRLLDAARRSGAGDMQRWAAMAARAHPDALHGASRSLVAWSDDGRLLAALHALGVPARYVYGDRSDVGPALAALPPIASSVIAGAGHFVMDDQPGAFYGWLASWLSGAAG